MMTGIFISYRREDSAGHAGRLFDRLTQHFGKGRVFMDVSDIEPGVDFVDAIDKAVGSCDALVVVIGRNWLTCVDAGGQRRLDDPNDFIRLETATALKRNIRVIPILVQGARMPKSEELPADLEKLARRQAIELSDTRWDSDVGQLIKALEAVLATEVERKSVSGQQETDTSRDKKADRKVITAVVSVVSVIALVVAGWLVWPRKVEVPRLTGNSMQGAKALLADRGLLAGIVNEEETERESPGMVLKQTPQAGERVEKGTKINLVLAIAPKVVVPDIIGKTFDQAATAVKTAGLNVGQRSSKQSSEAAAGIVLLQNPTAGTRVDKTVKVDVTVATTPRVVVPSTIGKTFAEAETSLRNAGLAAGMRRTKESAEAPPGVVLSQRPAAGEIVQQRARVDLVVAAKPAVLVPEIVKLSLAEAKTRLENVGLGLGQTRRREIYEPIATGNILEQIPRPGERVEKGTQVDVVISVRPSAVVVPDLLGKSLEEARALTGRGGLQVGALQKMRSPGAPGIVLKQSPSAGEKVKWGEKIELTIAARPETAETGRSSSIHSQGRLEIRAGSAGNLDKGSVGSPANGDIGFPLISAAGPYIRPLNNAVIAKVPRVSPDGKSCASAPFSSDRIFIRDLPQNAPVCVRTNQGRYAVFRIVEPINPGAPTLRISYTTWE